MFACCFYSIRRVWLLGHCGRVLKLKESLERPSYSFTEDEGRANEVEDFCQSVANCLISPFVCRYIEEFYSILFSSCVPKRPP